MFLFLLIVLFLLGLAVGSFLNALIYRLHTNESIARGRSHCPHCQHKLSGKDLIPLVSFALLRGRCRYCRQPISWQYPVVELMTGLIFFLIGFVQTQSWAVFGITATAVIYLVFLLFMAAVLVVVFVYDLKHYLILDKVIFPALAIAVLAAVFLPQIPFLKALLGSAVTGGFFLILVLLSKERWMGWGDVKLGFLIGLVVFWPQTIVLLLLAFIGGSMVSLLLVACKIKTMKDAVPFGTFLAAAAVATFIFGQPLVTWYLGLIM